MITFDVLCEFLNLQHSIILALDILLIINAPESPDLLLKLVFSLLSRVFKIVSRYDLFL